MQRDEDVFCTLRPDTVSGDSSKAGLEMSASWERHCFFFVIIILYVGTSENVMSRTRSVKIQSESRCEMSFPFVPCYPSLQQTLLWCIQRQDGGRGKTGVALNV